MRDTGQPVPEEEIEHEIETESEAQFSQRVREWSLMWLEDFYEDKINLPEDSFEVSDAFLNHLEGIVNHQSNYRKAVEIFLNATIDFVRQKSANVEERGRVDNFTKKLSRVLSGGHPGILSAASPETQLIIVTRANRVLELQGYLGQAMTSELAYNFAWNEAGTPEDIAREIEKLNLPEQLDAIDQLQTVAAVALAEQPEGRGSNAVRTAETIIRILKRKNTSPFFQYKTELASARLNQEQMEPSVGVFSIPGERGVKSRLSEKFDPYKEDHDRIRFQVNPDKILEKGTRFLRLSSDTVGLFDHSNTLRDFFTLEHAAEGQPQKLSLVAVNHLIYGLEHDIYPHPLDLEGVIEYLSTQTAPVPRSLSQALVNEWHHLAKARRYRPEQERLRELEAMTRKIIRLEDQNNEQEPIDGKYELGLAKYLRKLRADVESNYKKVEIRDVEEISKDSQLNPFASGTDQDLALLVKHLHHPELRQQIEADLGINLSEIPLRSQIHLLKFLSEQNREGFDRLRSILHQTHGAQPEIPNKALQAFVGCAENSQFGEVLLNFVERRVEAGDLKALSEVLDKYIEITKTSDQVQQVLSQRYLGSENAELIQLVQQNIIIRANKLLEQANEGLVERINLEQANAALLAATIRSVVESGGNLESIKGLSATEVAGPELSAEDAANMEEIYGKNWIAKTTPEYWQLLREKFETSTKNPKARFRVLRDNGKIIAFLRFMETEDQSGKSYIHFGAFNVDPAYQNGKIGEDFLSPAIALEKQKGLPIRCETNPSNPMLRKYLALGFQKVGEAVEHGEPEVRLEIPV